MRLMEKPIPFRSAKGGCFAENMITQAVPLTSEVKLNGEALEIKGITPEG
jgi:hypothetical protein